jgi:hypothetical protein
MTFFRHVASKLSDFHGFAFLDMLLQLRTEVFLSFVNAIDMVTSLKIVKLKLMLLWTIHEAKYLCIIGAESLFKSFIAG